MVTLELCLLKRINAIMVLPLVHGPLAVTDDMFNLGDMSTQFMQLAFSLLIFLPLALELTEQVLFALLVLLLMHESIRNFFEDITAIPVRVSPGPLERRHGPFLQLNGQVSFERLLVNLLSQLFSVPQLIVLLLRFHGQFRFLRFECGQSGLAQFAFEAVRISH